MHPGSARTVVTLLWAMGLSQKRIAETTAIPRTTVREWLTHEPRRRRTRPRQIRPADERAYSYLLGLYLGDGHVVKIPRSYVLRIYLDSRYPGIVGQCIRAMQAVLPDRRASARRRKPHNLCIATIHSAGLPEMFPQHGPGRKHERPIVLEPWQAEITRAYPEEFVRGLIHSDGSRFINPVQHPKTGKIYTYPRYNFSNRSEDIRELFCEHLDMLGVSWRRVGKWQISIARRESVARLDEFIGPKA